jgi:hypothetical protein
MGSIKEISNYKSQIPNKLQNSNLNEIPKNQMSNKIQEPSIKQISKFPNPDRRSGTKFQN